MPFKDATVILFKCDKSRKSFGVRVEKEKNNDWGRTWAFPVDDKTEKNENYAQQKVVGNLYYTEEYCGCPYCKTTGFMMCGKCKKITCYDDDRGGISTCQWCGQECKISTATDKFNVSGTNF